MAPNPLRTVVILTLVVIAVKGFSTFNSTHVRAHRHSRSRYRRQGSEDGRPYILSGGEGSESGPWSPWSEPSDCSRTCGGGVFVEQRHCMVEGACTGAPKRYFSCNIEDCPIGSEDFRAEQCAVYNEVEFEGQYYEWVPYRKAANKCQLNCMPRGERFYYRHQDKVHDGTPCTEDSYDLCIDGECVEVGCDRLLGSRTKEDVCRVCGGDGSSCTTISENFDSNELDSGYNDLALIPEGATNIKIKEKSPSSNYLAIRNKTGHYYLNGNWRIDFPRSLRFAGTVFTYSRKPFGFWAPESITAPGPTNEAIYIVLLYQERNPGIEYTYSVPKGTVHETSPQGYGWQFGEWTPCNATCGSGFQQREVWCALRGNGSRASPELCDPTTEPGWIQACAVAACPPGWTAGPWSPCSVSCGPNGTQTRQVYCTQDDGSGRPTLAKDDSACQESGPKPPQSQTCQGPPICPSWHLGPWKPCDRLCGPGVMRRELNCFSKSDDGQIELLDEASCGAEKPEHEKPCNLRPCEGLDWISGDWSGCEEKCGLAFETRTTYCGNQKGVPYPDDMCHAYRKPELVRNCTYTPCASQWYTSQWSACSSKCGTGVQTRSVFCASFEGDLLKKVDDSSCDPEQKYEDKQECKVEAECKGEWFYGPFSSCSKPCGGGMMSRKILCVKNNQTVDINECSVKSIGSTSELCNQQPCGEDEIIPVEPTQTISEEYSEECEDDYDYDYDSEVSYIKVPSQFDSSTLDSLKLVDEDLLNTTGSTTDEDEGSGGYSDDFLTVSSTGGVTSESSLSSSESSDMSLSPESSTISDLLSTLYASSSSLFGSSFGISDSSSESSPSPSTESSSDSGLEVSSKGASSSEESVTSEAGPTSEGALTSDDSATSVSESSSEPSASSSSGTSASPVSSSDDMLSDSTSEATSSSSDMSSPSSSDSTTSTSLSSSEASSSSDSSISTDSSSSDMSTLSSETSSSAETTTNSLTSDSSSDSTSTGEESTTVLMTGSDDASTVSSTDISATSEAISSSTEDSISSSTSPSDVTTLGVDLTSTSDSSSSDGESSSESSVDSSSLTTTSLDVSSSSPDTSTQITSESSTFESSSISSESSEETSEIETSSYSEAVFGVSTPSMLDKAVTSELKPKQCKRRPKQRKCLKSEFGCCPDNRTPAKGPFGKDCPMPVTCAESEFGCCPDEVSPAKGPKKRGCPPTYCEQTLFGCCQDKLTPAMGNDFEGCPVEITTFIPDCSSSEFGCCPDGILSASGPKHKGCPGCDESEFGCCPDGITTATGPDNFGCDLEVATTIEPGENITADCENSKHGCCPDGVSPALGPNDAGCACSGSEFGCCPDGETEASGPDGKGCQAECAGGEFGCCDDNVTLAHGPNKEGCCLLSPYGCCPDNVLPARGPNFQDCGCEYSPHGCCPDNRTAARGPGNEGCGCQYTTHGCCPNKYTPAAGPKFQGCPCHTYQFGCCPDGVTTAIGPHLQGCGCEDSEFGCCSDGRTPAPDASKNCSCAASKYGCCLDGITESQGEDFEGCSGKPVFKGEYCTLPKKLGECRNLAIKWYFDMEYGGCSRFWYGGCGGNGNRFSSAEECKDTCVEAQGKERCYLPKIEGPCKSYYPRWYYDKERKSCSQFIYSGCLGNTNRFETREECDELCGTQDYLDPCDQKVDGGPCEGNFSRWYFDKEAQACTEFDYGGCKGTKNNFLTESACKIKCLQPGKSREECALPRERGTCDGKEPKWYFDYLENKCLPFHYSGCGGNGNNFGSRSECEEACPPRIELDTCALPALEGSCHNYTQRYFYDVMRQTCRPFYYGGCGGNRNNFYTEEECQQRCDPKSLPEQTPQRFEKQMCFLESDAGSCGGSDIKWYYSHQDGICKQFRFTGCGGNGNRFENRQDCEHSCSDVQDVCSLPRVVGPCNGSQRQWHYDPASGNCLAFDYGGCQGNGNRFDSEEDCRRQCVRQPAPPVAQPAEYQDICYVSVDPGPCLRQIPAWFYDPSSGSCQQFNYGGCEGNANRFASEEQCERQCGQFKGQDSCSGEKEVGQCENSIEKFYYDQPSDSCLSFVYSGCGGNPNRFSTVGECQSICQTRIEPPISSQDHSPATNQAICALPMEAGVCNQNHRRWYYESRRRSCTQFIYTGCAGNLNNFLSFQECNDFCLPTSKQPPPVDENEVGVDEARRKEACAETERRCQAVSSCRYGLEQWVDADGCAACRCHEPCLVSPPDCPPQHSCQVTLRRNPQTAVPEYQAVCIPDTKPGECPRIADESRCTEECRVDNDCPGELKCCYTGCGNVCTDPHQPATQEPPQIYQATAEAPTISQQTPSEEASPEGSYVTFNCIAQGRPRPTVTWYRGDEQLPLNETGGGSYRLLENGTLQVIGLETSASGKYTCRASNGIEPDATRDYMLTVTAGVPRDAGVVGEENSGLVVKMDRPAVLTCYAIGWPRPAVTWWRGPDMLPITSESLEQRRDNTLLIRRVTLRSLGFYTCQAYNGQGRAASWTVALKVHGPITLLDPNDVTYNQFILPPPRVPLPPQLRPALPTYPPVYPTVPVVANISSISREVNPGQNVTLTCDVSGNPQPRITWFLNKAPIPSRPRLEVSGNKLTISDARVEDSGEYSCVADNGYNQAHAYVTLNVRGVHISPDCTDSPFLANCKLIIEARYCNHKFYAKFCCKSCTEAGQLKSSNSPPSNSLRRRRFARDRLSRIPSL